MRRLPQLKVATLRFGFAPRLASLYIALFFLGGIQLPFLPMWLRAKGLDPAMIGLVLATPMVVRVLAIPFATRQADRRDALRAALIAACAVTVAGYVVVAFASGAVAILLAYALVSLAYTPIMPLTETYALKGLRARGRAYGPVRLWGSAAFIVGSFVAGFAADTFPARDLIWLIVMASAICVIAAVALEPLSTAAPATDAAPPLRKPLLRDPVFIAMVASASLIQASHAVYYAFSALQWRAEGFDGTAVAALWAIGVIAEIVLFAVSGRLPLWMTPGMLLMIGAGGGLLRWGAMAFNPPGAALPWLQLLHAATFGASHLGALMFLQRYAPAGKSATAQGYLAIAMGAAMAGATGISGVLYEAYGTAAYAAMALAAVAGGACAAVAQRSGRIAAL